MLGTKLVLMPSVAAVMFDDAGRVLLARRPPTGVWSGLWSLPEADGHDAARAFVAAHAPVDFDAAEALPLIEHVFSHYRLHIEPLLWHGSPAPRRVGDNDDVRWHPLDRLEDVGLPAPVRKLLEGMPR